MADISKTVTAEQVRDRERLEDMCKAVLKGGYCTPPWKHKDGSHELFGQDVVALARSLLANVDQPQPDTDGACYVVIKDPGPDARFIEMEDAQGRSRSFAKTEKHGEDFHRIGPFYASRAAAAEAVQPPTLVLVVAATQFAKEVGETLTDGAGQAFLGENGFHLSGVLKAEAALHAALEAEPETAPEQGLVVEQARTPEVAKELVRRAAELEETVLKAIDTLADHPLASFAGATHVTEALAILNAGIAGQKGEQTDDLSTVVDVIESQLAANKDDSFVAFQGTTPGECRAMLITITGAVTKQVDNQPSRLDAAELLLARMRGES